MTSPDLEGVIITAAELARFERVERAYQALKASTRTAQAQAASVPAGNLRSTYPGWTVGRRIGVVLGFVVMLIVSALALLAVLGAILAANSGTGTPVTSHTSSVVIAGTPSVTPCPTGTLGARNGTLPAVWVAQDTGACFATVVVHGVTVGFVRNADGSTLATWSYGNTTGAMGYDTGNNPDSHAGYFTNTD